MHISELHVFFCHSLLFFFCCLFFVNSVICYSSSEKRIQLFSCYKQENLLKSPLSYFLFCFIEREYSSSAYFLCVCIKTKHKIIQLYKEEKMYFQTKQITLISSQYIGETLQTMVTPCHDLTTTCFCIMLKRRCEEDTNIKKRTSWLLAPG